jgi:hypothetical protein
MSDTCGDADGLEKISGTGIVYWRAKINFQLQGNKV